MKISGKNLKAAVIGVGDMGRNHARVINSLEGVELVAISDRDEKKLKDVSEKYSAGNVKAYTDYNELLEKEKPDIVSVVVPTEFHKEVALAVINNKSNVLVEKPIAFDENEAEEIIDAANKNNVKLMVGHIERFNPAVIELKKQLEAGNLGKIYKIDVERIGPFPNRIADVGVIIDLSVHDLDIIGYLLKEKPLTLFAKTQQVLHQKAEDSVVALLKYPDDILATLNINFLSPTKIRQLSIFGKKGMFRVDYLMQELFFCENPSYDIEAEKQGSMWAVTEGHMEKIKIDKKEPLLAEIEAFVDCVQNSKQGKPAPVPVSGEQGLEVLHIANLLKKSAEEKKILEL